MQKLACIVIALIASMLVISCDGQPAERATPAASRDAQPTTLRLKVEGMTCEGCESAIRETLAALPGVSKVTAAHATGEVEVETTDASGRQAIVAAIEKMNYTVVQ